MLQILREKAQGLIAWFIVLMIAAAFAFFGLTDYFSFTGRANAAKVNHEKISWQSVDSMYERVSQQYGGQVDPKNLKNQVLMALVQRAALLSNAKSMGFRVSEEQVANLLVQIPAFQVNGKFSKDQYLKVLSQASTTDLGFRQELTQDVLLGQLEQGLLKSSFIMPNEMESTIALLDQKRDFGYMTIPANKFRKEIKISPADLKTYYEEHKINFVKPEQIVLEYVELSQEQLAKSIKPSKQDILAYYNEHQSVYTMPERIHARHIVIAAPEGDVALDEEAKDKINSIQADIKKGADFSTIASKTSDDPGSADKGGDLGWLVRGQVVPEFEKVAFELKKPGQVSEPVRTSFGYHLIQLVEHKDSEVRPFNEVQNLVEEQLKMEKAQALFAEKGEQFAKLSFEEASSLAPVAAQLNLQIKETEPFGRQGGKDVAALPEVIKIAFSDELLKQSHNSEPVKLSENTTAIFRVKNHQPSQQQTFEQVEKAVHDLLMAEREKTELQSFGEKLVKAIQNGAKPNDLAKREKVEWIVKNNVIRTPEGKDRNAVQVAYQLPQQGNQKPNVKGVSLPSGDYMIVVLNKVIPGKWSKIDAETQKTYLKGLADFTGQLEFASYASQALQDAKIEFSKEPD